MKNSKPIIRMIVVQDDDGFIAFSTVHHNFIVAMGSVFDEFLDNLLHAVNAEFEEEGIQYTLAEIGLISCKAEGVSLIDAYKDINLEQK